MSLLSIAHLGHPILRQKALEVSASEIKSLEFQKFLKDLVETMHEYDGVGLASTQVHVPKRVFVFEVSDKNNLPTKEQISLTVVINPLLKNLSDAKNSNWEGCLSLPGIYGKVPRHNSVLLTGLNPKGQKIEIPLQGFPARVVQHETDHLDGIVFIDRMVSLESLCFEREYRRFVLGG